MPALSPQDARARQQAGALLLDVREPAEWRAGHIPGALHIPLGSLQQRLGELDREQEIIVVCRSGNRSAHAVAALQAAGYHNTHNLSGGMMAWSRQRLPVVTG